MKKQLRTENGMRLPEKANMSSIMTNEVFMMDKARKRIRYEFLLNAVRYRSKRITAFAVCLLLAGYLACSGCVSGIRAYAADGQQLVVEVVEEIPADDIVELEDNEVPLAAGPAERVFPILPVIYLGAAALAYAGYEMIGHRKRNALLKIRREGYREEARQRKEKEAVR